MHPVEIYLASLHASLGAGIPDGGLFSSKELKKHGHEANTLFGKLKSERGVIEVKPLDRDLSALEASPQILYNLENYGQILFTKKRDFSTIGTAKDADAGNSPSRAASPR